MFNLPLKNIITDIDCLVEMEQVIFHGLYSEFILIREWEWRARAIPRVVFGVGSNVDMPIAIYERGVATIRAVVLGEPSLFALVIDDDDRSDSIPEGSLRSLIPRVSL